MSDASGARTMRSGRSVAATSSRTEPAPADSALRQALARKWGLPLSMRSRTDSLHRTCLTKGLPCPGAGHPGTRAILWKRSTQRRPPALRSAGSISELSGIGAAGLARRKAGRGIGGGHIVEENLCTCAARDRAIFWMPSPAGAGRRVDVILASILNSYPRIEDRPAEPILRRALPCGDR